MSFPPRGKGCVDASVARPQTCDARIRLGGAVSASPIRDTAPIRGRYAYRGRIVIIAKLGCGIAILWFRIGAKSQFLKLSRPLFLKLNNTDLFFRENRKTTTSSCVLLGRTINSPATIISPATIFHSATGKNHDVS